MVANLTAPGTPEPTLRDVLDAVNGLSSRMDRLETKVDGLEGRMNRLESKMDRNFETVIGMLGNLSVTTVRQPRRALREN